MSLEKERSFLRYLWWENVNLEKLDYDIDYDYKFDYKHDIDHEMCVYVFGGTSSTGYCNYAI